MNGSGFGACLDSAASSRRLEFEMTKKRTMNESIDVRAHMCTHAYIHLCERVSECVSSGDVVTDTRPTTSGSCTARIHLFGQLVLL